MTRWIAIGGLALTAAVVILALRLRHLERVVAALQVRMDRPKVEPIGLRTDWAIAERSAVLHAPIPVRRLGEDQGEIVRAGAWIGEGQYVQIRGDVAYPTPYPGD